MARKTKQQAEMPERWKNRIVAQGEEAPNQLLANPFNFRVHSAAQQKAMSTMLNGIGWVQNVIVNRTTGHIVDGHMRVQIALKKGEPKIPVVYVELAPDEEKMVLAAYDPIGAMAGTDHAKMADLMRDIRKMDAEAQAFADVASKKTKTMMLDITAQDEEAFNALREGKQQNEVKGYTLHTRFGSSNRWDIPDLKGDMLCEQPVHQVWAGTGDLANSPPNVDDDLFLDDRLPGQFKTGGGVLSFFVWDSHFENVWHNFLEAMDRFKHHGFRAIGEPDFSYSATDPLPLILYQMFRGRWCARYWQEDGIKIIPTLQMVPSSLDEIAYSTLPKCPLMAGQTRMYETDTDRKLYMRNIRAAHDICGTKTFILYGGEEHRNWIEPNMPKGTSAIYLSSVANLRLKHNKAKKAKSKEEA